METYSLEMPVPLLRAMFAKDYASHFGDASSKITATELGQAHVNDITCAQNVSGINTLFFLLLIGAEIQPVGVRKRSYLFIDYAGERFDDVFGQKGDSTLANRLSAAYPMKTSDFSMSPIDAACGLCTRLSPVANDLCVADFGVLFGTLIKKTSGEFKTDSSYEFTGYPARLLRGFK